MIFTVFSLRVEAGRKWHTAAFFEPNRTPLWQHCCPRPRYLLHPCHCSGAALELFHEPPHPAEAPRARPAAQAAHRPRGHHELSVAEARRYHVRPRPPRTLDTTTLASSRHCSKHRHLIMGRKTESPSPRSRSPRSSLPPACTRPSWVPAAAALCAAAPRKTPRRSAPS